jgi:protein SCO1/2
MTRFQLTIRIALLCGLTFTTASLASGRLQDNLTVEESDQLPSYDASKVPEIARDIGIDEKTGNVIGLDTSFDDEQNNFVRLKQFFDGKHPVMLSFNYSNCPKLCSVQLENMLLCLRQVDLDAGKDFQMISISMDPLEQSARARETKAKFTKLYNRKGTDDGFHFLVGDRDSISFLADECGFRYKYVPRQKLYSHLPCFILISPEGKIVRYIHGLDYDPTTMKRALVEASEGRIGTPINRLSYGLGCYLFDESTGKYTPQAMVFVRLGGVATVVVLLVTLVPYWVFRRGQKAADGQLPGEVDGQLVHPPAL